MQKGGPQLMQRGHGRRLSSPLPNAADPVKGILYYRLTVVMFPNEGYIDKYSNSIVLLQNTYPLVRPHNTTTASV